MREPLLQQNNNEMDLKKLLVRSVSGLVYCLLIVGGVLLGNYGIAILGIILSTFAGIELANICHELQPRNRGLLVIDIAAYWCLALTAINPAFLLLWISLIICRMIAQLYVKTDTPLRDLSHSLMSQIYIGLAIFSMSIMAFMGCDRLILLLFILIWANDTGAYLIGSLLGRHRLFERISPKKSWEGFFGGMIVSLGVVAALFFVCPGTFGMSQFLHNIWYSLGFSIVAVLFGTWGDLVESLIKRTLHIKDSGKIIPGHGGILDRIDSILLALPAILIYIILIRL